MYPSSSAIAPIELKPKLTVRHFSAAPDKSGYSFTVSPRDVASPFVIRKSFLVSLEEVIYVTVIPEKTDANIGFAGLINIPAPSWEYPEASSL